MTRRNEDFDEFCDPENPRILKYEEVVQAARSIKPYVLFTPCMAAHTQRDFGIYIHYKLETLQNTGCFKERGGLYCLQRLSNEKKRLGVVVASTGNEAIGLCYHAARLNIPVVAVAPTSLPLSRMQRITKYGGKIVLYGNTYTDASKYARTLAKERGLAYINIRDHPQALAGFGTVGLEIMEQAPFADAVLLPLGSGALAASVAAVIKHRKPSCLVYAVEPENLSLMTKSLDHGEPLITTPTQGSLAGNSLTINCVGVNSFATAKPLLDKVLLVKEDWIARSMLHLAEREKFVVEGTAACTLAAIIGNLVPELKAKNVVCVLSGGNVDGLMFNRCMERGLAAEGRLIKFKVRIPHAPGQKAALTGLIANSNYNIITHFIDNSWLQGDTFMCEVKLVVETKGMEHSLELKRLIERAYPDAVQFESEPFNDRRTCPCYIKK